MPCLASVGRIRLAALFLLAFSRLPFLFLRASFSSLTLLHTLATCGELLEEFVDRCASSSGSIQPRCNLFGMTYTARWPLQTERVGDEAASQPPPLMQRWLSWY